MKAEIIINGIIDNQQKQIILSKENPISNTYHITIDQEYHGMVMRNMNGWKVYPHENSWLNGENCDIILQGILNVESPNS